MSVTTAGPVNATQVLAQLDTKATTLRIEGDPTNAGAILSAEGVTDEALTAALAAITYDPTFGATAAQANVVAQVAQLPAKLAQASADAQAFAAMTTAELTGANALAIHQRMVDGMAELTAGLWDLLTLLGHAPPRPGP